MNIFCNRFLECLEDLWGLKIMEELKKGDMTNSNLFYSDRKY